MDLQGPGKVSHLWILVGYVLITIDSLDNLCIGGRTRS
jgi:hypothetical protein